ncbi:MAG TPA: DUF4258 domain-containing protein [Phycisphaerae bacterium]|nr:DUF4258 domain-containing protein [Phycisphaerae bacterium]
MQISEKVIRTKVATGQLDFSVHAIFEAAADLLFVDEIETAMARGEIIEDDTPRHQCLGSVKDHGERADSRRA